MIDAELLAKHPEAPLEDAQSASEDEPPTTEPPTEEVAKINSGYATSFPFVVKLKTIAGLCSGALISPRALLTCRPGRRNSVLLEQQFRRELVCSHLDGLDPDRRHGLHVGIRVHLPR